MMMPSKDMICNKYDTACALLFLPAEILFHIFSPTFLHHFIYYIYIYATTFIHIYQLYYIFFPSKVYFDI